MEIKVTIEAEARLLAVLQDIAATLSERKQAPVVSMKKAVKEEVVKDDEGPKTEEPKAKEVSKEELRLLVMSKSDKHKTKIKSILSEFGAANVSTLQKEHFANFYQKVAEL